MLGPSCLGRGKGASKLVSHHLTPSDFHKDDIYFGITTTTMISIDEWSRSDALCFMILSNQSVVIAVLLDMWSSSTVISIMESVAIIGKDFEETNRKG